MQTEEVNKMFADLLTRGTTTVHAVGLQNAGPSVTTEIATTLSKNTGGSFTLLTTTGALQGKLKEIGMQVAEDHKKMSIRYQLEYVSEGAGTGTAVSVGIRRPGVQRTISFRRPVVG